MSVLHLINLIGSLKSVKCSTQIESCRPKYDGCQRNFSDLSSILLYCRWCVSNFLLSLVSFLDFIWVLDFSPIYMTVRLLSMHMVWVGPQHVWWTPVCSKSIIKQFKNEMETYLKNCKKAFMLLSVVCFFSSKFKKISSNMHSFLFCSRSTNFNTGSEVRDVLWRFFNTWSRILCFKSEEMYYAPILEISTCLLNIENDSLFRVL